MTEEVRYYRHVQPVASPPPPPNTEMFGFEYRTFLVVRRDTNYMLWSIEMQDHSKPPLELRGSFTTRAKARSQIDAFLDNEIRNQKIADDIRSNP
jgi:hypothetical protein